MTDTPQHRQLCALGFCAFTVTSVLLLPRAGWLWTGIAGSSCALLIGLIALFCRRRGQTLGEAAVAGRGGRFLLGAIFLWNLLMLGAGARQLCAAYPGGSSLVGLIVLLLAAWGANKGGGTVARVGAVSFFFLIIIYSIVLAFAAPGIHPEWLKPQTAPLWTQLPSVLCPVLLFFLAGRGGQGKCRLWAWLLLSVAFAVATAAVTAGRLSPEVVRQDPFPFYTMTQGISLLNTMERFEALVSAALTAGGFCLLSILCLANHAGASVLCPRIQNKTAVINFFCGWGGFWLSGRIPGEILAGGTAIFWGLFPILILSLGKAKKV